MIGYTFRFNGMQTDDNASTLTAALNGIPGVKARVSHE